jgi:hypothetical protein
VSDYCRSIDKIDSHNKFGRSDDGGAVIKLVIMVGIDIALIDRTSFIPQIVRVDQPTHTGGRIGITCTTTIDTNGIEHGHI